MYGPYSPPTKKQTNKQKNNNKIKRKNTKQYSYLTERNQPGLTFGSLLTFEN